MDWLANLWISSLIVLPFLGTLFLFFIPGYEKLLRRKVSLSIVGACAAILARNAHLLFTDTLEPLNLTSLSPIGVAHSYGFRLDYLSCLGLSYLLLAVFFLLYCGPGKSGQTHSDNNAEILFIFGLSSAGILIENFGFSILIQYAVIMFLFSLNLGTGGPYRSSSTLASSIFFTVIDLGAFFAWSFQNDILKFIDTNIFTIILLLPFLTRLTTPFFTPWSRLFFANSTIQTTALYLGTSFVVGGIGLSRLQFHNSFLVDLVTIAALFGALLSFADKSLKDFLMRFASVAGCLAAAALVSEPSHYHAVNSVIFLGTVSLVMIIALFVQNHLENSDEKMNPKLYALWMASISLLIGIPYLGVGMTIWHILPLSSLSWFLVFGLLYFALSQNLRKILFVSTVLRMHASPAGYNPNFLNTWICLALVVATSISFQLLFSQAV